MTLNTLHSVAFDKTNIYYRLNRFFLIQPRSGVQICRGVVIQNDNEQLYQDRLNSRDDCGHVRHGECSNKYWCDEREPRVGSPNACTAPCECISMNEAAQRWGAEGYETCSKSICGQSANAMTQYYCIHQIGGSSSPAVTTCQAPCECLSESGAITKWGTNGYTQCTKTTCGQEATQRRDSCPLLFPAVWIHAPVRRSNDNRCRPLQQQLRRPLRCSRR